MYSPGPDKVSGTVLLLSACIRVHPWQKGGGALRHAAYTTVYVADSSVSAACTNRSIVDTFGVGG